MLYFLLFNVLKLQISSSEFGARRGKIPRSYSGEAHKKTVSVYTYFPLLYQRGAHARSGVRDDSSFSPFVHEILIYFCTVYPPISRKSTLKFTFECFKTVVYSVGSSMNQLSCSS